LKRRAHDPRTTIHSFIGHSFIGSKGAAPLDLEELGTTAIREPQEEVAPVDAHRHVSSPYERGKIPEHRSEGDLHALRQERAKESLRLIAGARYLVRPPRPA
jgi:hypothetical protein